MSKINWNKYNSIRYLKKRGYKVNTRNQIINTPAQNEITPIEKKHICRLQKFQFANQLTLI